jgi:hypothetical protein
MSTNKKFQWKTSRAIYQKVKKNKFSNALAIPEKHGSRRQVDKQGRALVEATSCGSKYLLLYLSVSLSVHQKHIYTINTTLKISPFTFLYPITPECT